MQMSGFGILPDITLSSTVDRGLPGVIIGDEEIIAIELRPHLRPSENLDFLLFITVLRAYKAL